MTPEGYAVIRTPWPFRQVVGDQSRSKTFDMPPRLHYEYPDLKIDGALGPETHEYGTTALHPSLHARPRPARNR